MYDEPRIIPLAYMKQNILHQTLLKLIQNSSTIGMTVRVTVTLKIAKRKQINKYIYLFIYIYINF